MFIDVARIGNLSETASVPFTVGGGTATPADYTPVPTGSLTFGANQAFARIAVTVNGDDLLEGQETFEVTLGGNAVAGRETATVRIGDDDALINEVLANVSNADDETNREYIELVGTPNALLDGYYFAVLEGEEEGDAGNLTDGSAAGVADFVFDLSGLRFGSNGLLVIVPGDDPETPEVEAWEYTSLADPATTIVETSALAGAGGVLEDSSQTYLLFAVPTSRSCKGFDYDQVGVYENGTNQAIGTGVGILDQLPAGASVVDSVGVVEGGGGDRDRVSTQRFPGNPGIHIHQPTGLSGSNGVTSDAFSRRFGQTLPNSIGAWFNGDIADGSPSSGLSYLNDRFQTSVVAPDGSELTPGAPNILRNVTFSIPDQFITVDQTPGGFTELVLTIQRTGDIANEQIEVFYETVDFGSAEEATSITRR